MYKLKRSTKKNAKFKTNLFGSGTILNEVLKAQEILEDDYKVAANVWSVTSYNELRKDALETTRWNMLHPSETPKKSYIAQMLEKEEGTFVAASDYIKALPDSVSKWFPRHLVTLGTDGFGRSEGRIELRDFFEVDAKHIVAATLYSLYYEKKIDAAAVEKAIKNLGVNPGKQNPMIS
jgi:pyruvate dehydrogenase E1 component